MNSATPTLSLESQISSVSVFQQGAEVTRLATVPEEGLSLPARISLEGLPVCLSDGSLSARVLGEARVVEASIDIALQSTLTVPEEQKKEMWTKQRCLRREASDLKWWLNTLKDCQLPTRPEGKEGEAPPKLSVQARLQWMEFLSEQTQAGQKRLWELEDSLEELRRELEKSERDDTDEAIVRKTAVLGLDGEGSLAGGTEVELSYRVPGVKWAPSYILKFDETLSKAEIGLHVSVAQETGEDWNEVKLSVTSADAQQARELPELMSLKIGRSQSAPPGSTWKAPPPDTDKLFQDFDRKIAQEGVKTLDLPIVEDAFFDDLDEDLEMVEELCEEPALEGAWGDSDTSSLAAFAPVTLAGGGGSFGGKPYLDKVGSAPPEGRADMRRRAAPAKKMKAAIAPGVAAAKPAPPSPPVPVPDPELRTYARLVMPSPKDSGRGRLRFQGLEEQVAEKARQSGLTEERFRRIAREAIQKAEAVGHQAFPNGLVSPRWPDEDGFDLYYSGESHCSVPSDGAFHSQALQALSVEVKPRYVSIPRETPQVFRYVEGATETPLPQGPCDIYVGREFLLNGSVPGVAPGGTLSLALGVEERVKIVRNTRFKESISGMVSKTRHLEHVLELEVVSNLPREALIEVRERLPHGAETEKDIEVSVTSSDPSWESFEPKNQPGFQGGKRWIVPISAGAKKELKATYTIAIPAKYDLADGNRRES